MTTVVTLTLNGNVFTAECDGLKGEASTRREALGELQAAFGRNHRWLNLGAHDLRVVGPTPEVGMAATYRIGSDSYAYTITRIVSPTRIELRPDRSVGRLYIPAAIDRAVIASLRKDGRWREARSKVGSFILGERETWLDPCF